MILKKKKLLFVHIPRTGGTSIEQAFNVKATGKVAPPPPHNSLKQYLEEVKCDNYFKFSFVRNPWDRLVSWYLWAHADVIYYQHMADQGRYCNKNPVRAWLRGKNIMEKGGGRYINKKFYLRFKNSFASFIENLPQVKLEDYASARDVNILNNRLSGKWIMPQVEWLKNKNQKIDMDFIGRYEKYPTDISRLFKKIGHKVSEVAVKGRILNKPSYRKFYTQKTQRIVGEVYKEDIEFFDYEF